MIAALVLLAQVACNPLSANNPTLYRPRDGGGVSCLDWSQASCSYVERPCQPAELAELCHFVAWGCVDPPLTDCFSVPLIPGPGMNVTCCEVFNGTVSCTTTTILPPKRRTTKEIRRPQL